MSRENVDLVRRRGEALSRGELPLELSDPDIRLDNIAEFPITGPYHGHEGFRRWWQDVAEAFDEIRFEIEELIDVDDERALSVQRVVGRFRRTGIPVDTPWASISRSGSTPPPSTASTLGRAELGGAMRARKLKR